MLKQVGFEMTLEGAEGRIYSIVYMVTRILPCGVLPNQTPNLTLTTILM